jgi:ABC transport system ATP-binding/permease protein
VRSQPAPVARGEKKRRLTFKETSELAALPQAIDVLERDRDAVYSSLSDPALLRDGAAITEARARLVAIEGELAARLARWEELETIAAQ